MSIDAGFKETSSFTVTLIAYEHTHPLQVMYEEFLRKNRQNFGYKWVFHLRIGMYCHDSIWQPNLWWCATFFLTFNWVLKPVGFVCKYLPFPHIVFDFAGCPMKSDLLSLGFNIFLSEPLGPPHSAWSCATRAVSRLDTIIATWSAGEKFDLVYRGKRVLVRRQFLQWEAEKGRVVFQYKWICSVEDASVPSRAIGDCWCLLDCDPRVVSDKEGWDVVCVLTDQSNLQRFGKKYYFEHSDGSEARRNLGSNILKKQTKKTSKISSTLIIFLGVLFCYRKFKKYGQVPWIIFSDLIFI